MDPTAAGPATLLRHDGAGWRPTLAAIPPVDHPDLHQPLAEGETVWWHFPADLDVDQGDVLIVREHTVTMLDRCGPNHWAVHRLAGICGAEWAAGRQVWSGRVVDPRSIR